MHLASFTRGSQPSRVQRIKGAMFGERSRTSHAAATNVRGELFGDSYRMEPRGWDGSSSRVTAVHDVRYHRGDFHHRGTSDTRL